MTKENWRVFYMMEYILFFEFGCDLQAIGRKDYFIIVTSGKTIYIAPWVSEVLCFLVFINRLQASSPENAS